MRRSTYVSKALLAATQCRLATSATEATPAASSSTSDVAVTSSTSSSSKKKSSVVTATTLHAGESPKVVQIDLSIPDDHTNIKLKSYVEPTPFVTPKMIRDFSFSLVVGASVIAAIHYILSSSIAENYEEEVAVLRRVTRDTSEVEKLPAKPEIPHFVAPSSYSILKKKMDEETRIAREKYLDIENKRETPVLHREFWQRMMFAWNNSLSSVEQSAAAVAVQYHNWRVKRMKQQVKDMLEGQNLTLVEMKQV